MNEILPVTETNNLKERLIQKFTGLFETEPLIVRSPGRVNIIGEHTDYNEGLVLPAAIDKYIYVAAAKNNMDSVRMFAVQYDERIDIPLTAVRENSGSWTNYILGVVSELNKLGLDIGGFDMVVDGDLPVGAGVSSSAAMECAVGEALNHLFYLNIDRAELITIAQAAEHNYAGVKCGIMDQFASARGAKNHGIFLDCRDHSHTLIPMDLKGYEIVLLNTNVKHSLASSEYNMRRMECEEGVELIHRHLPRIKSLRDVTINMLIQYVHDPLIFSRCKYVIEENARVQLAVQFLQRGNITALGQLMYKTHDGLTFDYDVSCTELDWLVANVRTRSEVAGARMMGGGFGGCTINLVRKGYTATLIRELGESYEQEMGRPLTPYIFNTANGTELYS